MRPVDLRGTVRTFVPALQIELQIAPTAEVLMQIGLVVRVLLRLFWALALDLRPENPPDEQVALPCEVAS